MTTAPHQSEYVRRYFERFFSHGQATALLVILDARRVQIPEDVRADIFACTDLDKLERWIRRAATPRRSTTSTIRVSTSVSLINPSTPRPAAGVISWIDHCREALGRLLCLGRPWAGPPPARSFGRPHAYQ
jgi:hypothetical protein